MPYTITPLTHQTLDSFYTVFSEVIRSEFTAYDPRVLEYFLKKAYSKDNFAHWLDHNLRTALLAYEEEKVAGFAVVDAPYGGVSLCRWLGVKKEHQKQGVGTVLIRHWLEYAKQQGCHKGELAALPTAVGFYEKMGLTLEGKRQLSYFGTDQYIFGKVIGSINVDAMVK